MELLNQELAALSLSNEGLSIMRESQFRISLRWHRWQSSPPCRFC